jgi:hypothetical protein
MTLAQRRPPRQACSLRERYWPGVRGYSWSVTRVAGLVPVIFVCAIMGLAYFVAVPISLLPLLHANTAIAVLLLVIFHFIYLNVVANVGLPKRIGGRARRSAANALV